MPAHNTKELLRLYDLAFGTVVKKGDSAADEISRSYLDLSIKTAWQSLKPNMERT
jgi:hypothetical protein